MTRCTVLALLVGTLAIGATAQPPAQQLKPGQLPINDAGDVLTRDISNSRRWTFKAQVRLLGFQPRARNVRNIAPTQSIEFDRMQFAYPLIGETASSVPYPEEARMKVEVDRPYSGPGERVRDPDRPFNEHTVTNTYRVEEGYQGPTDLMILETGALSSTHLLFTIELDVRCWETRIDEVAADAIEWPTDPWPPQLVSALDDQLFVNPKHPAVIALLDRWLDGKNPRDARPYALAKYLAGRVVEYVKLTEGDNHATGRTAFIGNGQRVLNSGFRVNGSVFAATTGTGTRFDSPALLCALYRAAGLPARLVIGFDKLESDLEGHRLPVLRSWVEFALLDEERDVTEWIPVDIARQRDFSDRAPALDTRWQFFGHNEEFDYVIPISYHWLPKTSVTNAGPPAIWGWLAEPAIPEVDSDITFEAGESATRATDPVDPFRR